LSGDGLPDVLATKDQLGIGNSPPRTGAGALQFFGKHAAFTHAQAFAAYLAPLRNSGWVVYCNA
jgi:hypothetical protein